MRVLHSKHQKLILQCYPPGKAVDKKPNPSELSYLLYYASTRRVKLEKVIDFLNHKTKSDARGNKSGNLQVTLSIVSALIEKCSDNLNAFALKVCSILVTVLNTRELPLCKALVGTYGVLCAQLDGGLFSGDKEFVDLFTELTEQMINTGVAQLKAQTPTQMEWRMISLITSRHVFNCLGFNTRLSRKFLGICVPLLSLAVLHTSSYNDLLTRLNSNLNVEPEPHLAKSVTGKTTTHREIENHFENDLLVENDLNEEALAGLKVLFNTSLSNQIAEATREVVENNFRMASETENDEWGTTFLEMCASWIPVQLRFVTLLTLLARLTVISEQANATTNNSSHMAHFAKYILGLVSSNFNMIGLSISDVIQHLLTLQTNLHLHIADFQTPKQVEDLSNIYSQCICNLSSHIYYFDQVQDSIEGILMQIDTVLISATVHKVSRVHSLVLTLLNTVSIVLNLLTTKSSSIARNLATLENWLVSLQLLSFSKSYHEFDVASSPEQVSSIQGKFLTVFLEFLTTELIRGDEKSGLKESVGNNAGPAAAFLRPNYHDYIDNSQNFVNHFLAHTNEYFASPDMSILVTRSLVETLQSLLSVTGVNFFHNFIPFFSLWQILVPSNVLNERAKDTVAYMLLKSLVEVLGQKYPEAMSADVTKLDFYSSLKEDISDRRSLGLWVTELDGSEGKSGVMMDVIPSDRVNRKTLFEFFSLTGLHKWINGQNGVSDRGSNLSEERLLEQYDRVSPGTDETYDHYEDARSPRHGVSGLGLGTAGDIISIHSGLLHGNLTVNGHLNGKGIPSLADVSQATASTLPTNGSLSYEQTHNNYRHSLLPRVKDLKQSVNGDDQFSFTHAQSTPRSVLQKQIHTTDVTLILNGLNSDDDSDIVV